MTGIAITKLFIFLDKGKKKQMELKNSSDWEIFFFPFSKIDWLCLKRFTGEYYSPSVR